MIELYQVSYSPFCIVQSRILDFTGQDYKKQEVPYGDRSIIWRLTRQRYYLVPIVKMDDTVVFETGTDSQVIAKFLSHTFQLNLFPSEFDGIQHLMWDYIENTVESCSFKLNDIHYQSFVRPEDQLDFIRHKERKFGPGCLSQWRDSWAALSRDLESALRPLERILETKPFLLADRPLFVDFDLFGILGNFLYSGHNDLPVSCPCLRRWHERMKSI